MKEIRMERIIQKKNGGITKGRGNVGGVASKIKVFESEHKLCQQV